MMMMMMRLRFLRTSFIYLAHSQSESIKIGGYRAQKAILRN